MIFLREIKRGASAPGLDYPFGAGLLKALDRLEFTQSVTIICGDNGSGKTTLLSLIAALCSAHMIGGTGLQHEKGRLFSQAARHFRAAMNRHPRSSFSFTAEDFSRYLDEQERMKKEAREGLRSIEEEYAGRGDYAKGMASMPYARSLQELETRYERDLARSSHGEGFLEFFGSRLVKNGLYLLDEPEGALSYQNQLSMLALIDSAVSNDGQVIMATHSPVLAAYPGATLLEAGADGIREVTYETISSVQFLKHFLMHPGAILRRAGIGPQDEEAERAPRGDH